MSTAATGLKELHRLHIQLQKVRERLEGGPRQIRAREKLVDQKKAEIEASKGQLKQLRMAADQKSLQLKTNESKILDLKAKLNAAASNREFDIIRSQIDADTMANSVLEDEILELLEKVDAHQSRIAKLEEEAKHAEAEKDRVKRQVGDAGPGLEGEASALATALKSAESTLPGAILETYRRLVQAHGAGALAPVASNKACGACHAIMSPQYFVDINTGKFVFCRSCGRLLYRDEPAGE
jgi:predicted  nucleic acid-binding Zn-ribbon protein